mmetsp:Transcript_14627/g.43940  ORF Transcript_14627/g.43940 Transcript_14627/m.43940 type:complete len:315 (-) Transcript_14627:42-986(-)
MEGEGALLQGLTDGLERWARAPGAIEEQIRTREASRRANLTGETDTCPMVWHAHVTRVAPPADGGHNVAVAVDRLLREAGGEALMFDRPPRRLLDTDEVAAAAAALGQGLLETCAVSVNTGLGEAGALLRHLESGGLILWPYDASDGAEASEWLMPSRARGVRTRYMIVLGFLLPYRQHPPVEGAPCIASVGGDLNIPERMVAGLEPEGWRGTFPGTKDYRSSQLLFVGYDAGADTLLVASFAALRTSNAQLLFTPMDEYDPEGMDEYEPEGMDMDGDGGATEVKHDDGSRTLRRRRKLAGRCVLIAVAPPPPT